MYRSVICIYLDGYHKLSVGIPLFYFWILWRNRIYIITRNGHFKDENDIIIVALSEDSNDLDKMNRENILESLDFLYSSYGKLMYANRCFHKAS
jgi:hypothetical protein